MEITNRKMLPEIGEPVFNEKIALTNQEVTLDSTPSHRSMRIQSSKASAIS
jgi:hypothetical protein